MNAAIILRNFFIRWREGKVGGNGRRSGGVYTLALATLTSILDSLLKYILSANPDGMFSAGTLMHNY